MSKLLKIQIRHVDHKKDGTVKKVHKWKTAHSLTAQFAQILGIIMSTVAANVKATDGSTNSTSNHVSLLSGNAGEGVDTKGILIGVGTTPPARSDYQIETELISNVTYSIATFEILNPVADDWHILIHRTFTNNTGAAFDVTEVALYSLGNVGYSFCLDHSAYGIHFGIGEQKTVTYKIQL